MPIYVVDKLKPAPSALGSSAQADNFKLIDAEDIADTRSGTSLQMSIDLLNTNVTFNKSNIERADKKITDVEASVNTLLSINLIDGGTSEQFLES